MAYSQASSHCGSWKKHQRNSVSLRPLNASEFDAGPESSAPNHLGNTVLDGKVWSSRGFKSYASSGNPNALTPLKSSWIQRLIPSSHITRLEQPQDTDSPRMESHGINGMWTDWKENTVIVSYSTVAANQSKTPLYENSRRSNHDFYSSHQTLLGTTTVHNGCGATNAATSSPFEASEAPLFVQPEVQVFPKPLPVVESLLPGYSKKVNERRQTSTETSKVHTLSKCTGFSNEVERTVHFSGDKRARVSCSLIEGLSSPSASPAAGSLAGFKSLWVGKSCFKPSQPMLESSLKGVEASTIALTSSGKDRHLSTNVSRGYMDLPETRPVVDSHQPTMPRRGEGIESFSNSPTHAKYVSSKTDERLLSGASMDQSNTDCWYPKEYHNYEGGASFRPEAFIERGASFDGEGLGQSMAKHTSQRASDTFSVYYGIKCAKAKAGFSSHQMLKQDLNSSNGCQQEQPGTSVSFSFHFGTLPLHKSEHAEGVGVEWPFSPATVPIGNSVQSSWRSTEGNADLVEASRPGNLYNNSATPERRNGGKARTSFISRGPCSPFFGIESSTELARHSLSIKDDILPLPFKATCNYTRSAFFGKENTDAVHGNGVDQLGDIEQQEKAKSVRGLHLSSRAEYEFKIKCTEDKELSNSRCCERTSNQNNWMGFKSCTKSSVHAPRLSGSILPAGAHLKKTGCTNKVYFEDHNTNVGSCPMTSVGGPSVTKEEGRLPGRHPNSKKPGALPLSALGKQSWDKGKKISGSLLNVAAGGMKSEAGVAVGWEGLVVKPKMWLQRWCTASSIRKAQGDSHWSGSRGVAQFSSENFDLRPAKRVCHEKRCGLQYEPGNVVSGFNSVALWRQHHASGGAASRVMKRFSTPSASAMAIMGTTARQAHATQPQKKGLFGVWASSKAPTVTSPIAQAEACKDFKTIHNSKKEFSEVAPEHFPTPVDMNSNGISSVLRRKDVEFQ